MSNEPYKTTSYVFNVGWSNKAKTIEWENIASSVEEMDCDLVVLTEVSNKTKVRQFTERLSRATDGVRHYESIIEEIGYDKIALIYDASRVKPKRDVHDYSREGKYLGALMQDQEDGKLFRSVATHLPIKNKRKVAVDALSAYICQHKTPTLIMGDFNSDPRSLKMLTDRVRGLALGDGEEDCEPTTLRGNCYDNLVHHSPKKNKHAVFIDTEVLQSAFGSDHYPVVSTHQC